VVANSRPGKPIGAGFYFTNVPAARTLELNIDHGRTKTNFFLRDQSESKVIVYEME